MSKEFNFHVNRPFYIVSRMPSHSNGVSIVHPR
jgi:hypothetical protein